MYRDFRRAVTALAVQGWALGLLLGCSSTETLSLELTRVVPAADPQCGAPADGRTLVVTGLGDFPAADVTTVSRQIDPGEPLTIDSFPLDTRVVRVEVLGDAGAVRAYGKTAPLDLSALSDGARLPVFMAPPGGACGTGPLIHARRQPLMARVAVALDGWTSPPPTGSLEDSVAGRVATELVVIAGGFGGADGRTPVIPIELYDPTTGQTVDQSGDQSGADQGEHYGTGEHGLIGATLTALPAAPTQPDSATGALVADAAGVPVSSKVLLAGGGVPAFQIFDGTTGRWGSPLFLSPGRGHHAAVALDERRVLLAGGCAPLNEDHECDVATADLGTSIVDIDTGAVSPGPRLFSQRIGGVAVRESANSALLIGGVDDQGVVLETIERVYLDGRTGELIASDGAGAAVTLASGSALFGFAPAGLPGVARLGIAPADGRSASTLPTPPWPLADATMTGLHDGAVLVVGQRGQVGPGASVAALFSPYRAGVAELDIPPERLPGAGHGALALADGAVLLVGGRPPGEPTAPPGNSAWIIRPDLTGPYTSDVIVSFADPERARHFIPRDPSQHTLAQLPDGAAHTLLTAGNDGDALPAEWAILAGPVFASAQLSARVRSLSGGVSLLFGFRAADEYLAVVFNPGQRATAYELVTGQPRALPGCVAEVIEPLQLAPATPGTTVEVSLAFSRSSATAMIAGQEVLRCPSPLDVSDPRATVGRVGIGVTGPAGAQLRVDLFSATR